MMDYFRKRAQIFRNRSFVLFALSGLAATFGNGLTYISLVWSIDSMKDSISSIALLMLCLWGPSILLAPLIGRITDSVNQKFLTTFSNLARGICLVTYPLLLTLSGSQLALPLTLGFTLGLFNSFYGPASMVLIRRIVAPEDLLYANATIDTIYELGSIVGMGSAGLTIYWFGETSTLFAGGILFLLAGSFLLFLRTDVVVANDSKSGDDHSFSTTWGYLLATPLLIRYYGAQALVMIILFTCPVLLVPYARQVLHASVVDFSHLEALFSVGAVVGGALTPYLTERFSRDTTLTFELLMLALIFVFLSTNQEIFFAKTALFGVGFCLSTWAVIVTRAQEATDIAMQGRIYALCNGVIGSFVLLLYFGLALLEDSVAVSALYAVEALVAGGALLLIAAGNPKPVCAT